MLPLKLKPLGFDTWKKESWDEYCLRLRLPADEATRQFYRQVVYDHFDHFNHHYPSFKIEDYTLAIRSLSASEAAEKIRTFGDQRMIKWCRQFDEFEKTNNRYPVFRSMAEKLTFPFPPVLIEPSGLLHPNRSYGRPFHLIEGTHRVSYLNRMLERGMIPPDSPHAFVCLEPGGTGQLT